MKPQTCTDSLLWKRFLEGDSSAYSQIYEQSVQELYRFGLLYTSDGELVKDCIQDVFVKIHMNRSRLGSTDNIIAYLTVALRNTLFNALKKVPDHFSIDELNETDNTDQEYHSPETLYIDHEQETQTYKQLHSIMSSLPDRQREIMYYRYIQDMSIDEISKMTAMNYQSVSNSIQRALGRIRGLFIKK